MPEFLNSMEWYYVAEEKDTVPSLFFKGRAKEDFEKWHSILKAELLDSMT